jgi:hypothetical protein
MTTRKDLPEAATEEPRILSPGELADRSTRRLEEGEEIHSAKEGRRLADPTSPVRIPGELSSRPDEEPSDQRPEPSRPDDDEGDDG